MTEEQTELLKDFEDDDLLEELRTRGVDLCEGCDCDCDEEQPAEPVELIELFSDREVDAWLRTSNPPQAIRDAYWNSIGRIL